MTSSDAPSLLDRDHGLDASSECYPDVVRSVFLAPWAARRSEEPDQPTQLAARTVVALNEVARWANDGQSADPTACAWLAYLRWALSNGACLPADAPVPPQDELDLDFPVLSAPGPHDGDSFQAIATGRLGEVARPVLPLAESPEVLARTAPYGLIPNIGWKSLIILALDSAAITHGSPEAQTAAAALALVVHAAARARATGGTLHEVVRETARVASEITRPAPRTHELLALCADPEALAPLWTEPGALASRLGRGDTATEALALGLAALLAVEDSGAAKATGSTNSARNSTGDDVAGAARALMAEHGVREGAAHDVAVVVAAARWGLAAAAPADDTDGTAAAASNRNAGDHAVAAPSPPHTPAPGVTATAPQDGKGEEGSAAARAELHALADRWNGLWRP